MFLASLFTAAWVVFARYPEVQCQQQTLRLVPHRPAARAPDGVCAQVHVNVVPFSRATGHSEQWAKIITSVTFFRTTRNVETSGHLNYFARALWRHFMVYWCFYVRILVTIWLNCLGDFYKVFFLWNSSSLLWTKKLHLTFVLHKGK